MPSFVFIAVNHEGFSDDSKCIVNAAAGGGLRG